MCVCVFLFRLWTPQNGSCPVDPCWFAFKYQLNGMCALRILASNHPVYPKYHTFAHTFREIQLLSPLSHFKGPGNKKGCIPFCDLDDGANRKTKGHCLWPQKSTPKSRNGVKIHHQKTAGLPPCVHVPGFHPFWVYLFTVAF